MHILQQDAIFISDLIFQGCLLTSFFLTLIVVEGETNVLNPVVPAKCAGGRIHLNDGAALLAS